MFLALCSMRNEICKLHFHRSGFLPMAVVLRQLRSLHTQLHVAWHLDLTGVQHILHLCRTVICAGYIVARCKTPPAARHLFPVQYSYCRTTRRCKACTCNLLVCEQRFPATSRTTPAHASGNRTRSHHPKLTHNILVHSSSFRVASHPSPV